MNEYLLRALEILRSNRDQASSQEALTYAVIGVGLELGLLSRALCAPQGGIDEPSLLDRVGRAADGINLLTSKIAEEEGFIK